MSAANATSTPARPASDPGALLGRWIVILVVAVPVAAIAFAEGRKDWQYELAGLADPFLGRPAPWLTVGIGVVLTVLVTIGVWIVRLLARRIEPAGVERGTPWRIRPRWWFVLVAGWLAFALGIASVAAAGGPRSYEGTMALTFGRPISRTIEVAAACRTAVGIPDVVAEVTPEAQGLPRLLLRDVPTGERNRWAEPSGVFVELMGGGLGATEYELPNVPARPLPYIEATLGDGAKHADPPIGFLRAYDYRVLDSAEDGMSGTVDVEGTRFADPFGGGTGPVTVQWVNLEIPNDPWPPTIMVRIEWTCRPRS